MEAKHTFQPELGKRYTIEDRAQWSDGNWELIEGIPYLMTSPSRAHQRVVFDLGVEVELQIRNDGSKCRVWSAPMDVILPQMVSNRNGVLQPDLMLVCDDWMDDDRTQEDKTEQLTEGYIRAVPIWIAEVLSPNTASKDRFEKFTLFQNAGVQEYWMIDPIHQFVNAYGLDGDVYRLRGEYYRHRSREIVLLGKYPILIENIFRY